MHTYSDYYFFFCLCYISRSGICLAAMLVDEGLVNMFIRNRETAIVMTYIVLKLTSHCLMSSKWISNTWKILIYEILTWKVRTRYMNRGMDSEINRTTDEFLVEFRLWSLQGVGTFGQDGVPMSRMRTPKSWNFKQYALTYGLEEWFQQNNTY